MARKKKDKKRATGIQAKNGYLYISSDEYKIVDGKRVRRQTWIMTGLRDTEENVKLAIEQRKNIIEQKKKHPMLVDRSITTEEYMKLFLEKAERTLADTTYATYLNRSKHICEHFCGIKIRDITTGMINDFFDGLLTKENPLGERTVKDTRQLLGKIMKRAVDEGIRPDNPVEKSTINKDLLRNTAKEKQVDDKLFSYEEAQRFLDGVEDSRWYEFFYFVLFFGLRSSCVSILVHENMDIKSIQNWAGHKDYETTLKHYAKVKDKEQKKEVADSMNRVIRKKDYNK